MSNSKVVGNTGKPKSSAVRETEIELNEEGIDDGLLPEPESTTPRRVPDINAYQQKKTLAQGMMDLALLSANANQLRYVLETGSKHNYYLANVILISASIILQVMVGIGLIWNTRYNVKKDSQMFFANRVNNLTIIGVFVITVLNVFISAFGIPGIDEIPPNTDVDLIPK